MDTGDGNDINVSLTLSLFTFHMAKAEKSNHGWNIYICPSQVDIPCPSSQSKHRGESFWQWTTILQCSNLDIQRSTWLLDIKVMQDMLVQPWL